MQRTANGIGLAEMVNALRNELSMVQKTAEKESLRFTVEDIELQLQIVYEKSDKANFGLSIQQ